MLFKRSFHQGLTSGAITLSFRVWKRPHVKSGGRHRCPPIGWLEVEAVERVAIAEISDADAARSGFESRSALIAYLEKSSKTSLEEDSEVFRVELRYAGPDDGPSPALDAALSPADAAELAARLERMDRRSRHGAWTAETLALIEKHPRTAAAKLAPLLGRETRPFKADVRKLKKLGLTLSHEVGYEISPRGRTFLAMRKRAGA